MKCPKCGFTSFDFLENCKKCGQDLQGHKQKFGLRSLIFPNFGAAAAPETAADDVVESAPMAAESATDGDFGFDFMSDENSAAEAAPDETTTVEAEAEKEQAPDEFSFDDEPEKEPAEADTAETAEDDLEGLDLADDFDFAVDEESAATNSSEDDVDEADEFAFAAAEDSIEVADAADDDEDIDFGDTAEDLDFTEPAEAQSEADNEDELDDWGVAEEEVAADEEEKASKETREASDPFDLRGPAETERAPDSKTDQPASTAADAFVAEESLPQADLFPPPEAENAGPEAVVLGQESEAAFGFLLDEAEQGSGLTAAAVADFEEDPDNDAEAVLLAPFGARLAAGLCDLLILVLVFVLFLIVGQQILFDAAPAGLLPDAKTLVDLSGPYFLVLFALSFGYFTLFHFLTGQTPGKMIFHLRVEDLAGQPLCFSQAFLHSVGGLFSLLPAGLGFLTIFFSRTRRGWNDLLAGSHLVPVLDPADESNEEQDF